MIWSSKCRGRRTRLPQQHARLTVSCKPQESYDHRVKVIGTVIYFEAGGLLFLQEGGQGISVQTQGREPLRR